jgi:glycosyltransferase involved in cell wall biosynthesis
MSKQHVAIVIPVFGDLGFWGPRSLEAHRSTLDLIVPPDTEISSYISKGGSLYSARNLGASYYKGFADWLIFLDADDTLPNDYVVEMMKGEGDIRVPRVAYCRDGFVQSPVALTPLPLEQGNHIVIGAMIRANTFFDNNGFRDLPAYEDWDLWLRCYRRGAKIGYVPGAIYHADDSRPDSRNKIPVKMARQLIEIISSGKELCPTTQLSETAASDLQGTLFR